jgi:predicted Fe-Mo cluster-binding NifX family protein
MRIAIPVANGQLSPHFGHCEKFVLLDVDPVTRRILKQEEVPAPPHQPGLLPGWLSERGAQVVIAGGIGARAQQLFQDREIKVVVGAPEDTPERTTMAYLEGNLKVGENACDH